MQIIAILAMTDSGLIGASGGLPWDIPEDRRRFRELTAGEAVVMGRATYFSLPEQFRPLPKRRNIVLTRTPIEGIETCTDIDTMLEALRGEGLEKCFIIGGAKMYDEFFSRGLIGRVELTLVHGEYEGDVKVKDFRDGFVEEGREEKEKCTFVSLIRNKAGKAVIPDLIRDPGS